MGRHNTIPDQIAGMKELAQKYSWIDIDKAAMWGHSGGGFITADALLRPPYNDFFKVGIAESGNHDQRQYEDDWGERYQGPLVKNPDGTDNYDIEANQSQAKNLKGHLFLIHGTMDNNVPPYNTLLVADALIKANKEFDLLLIPNSAHGYTPANYVMRRPVGLLREVSARRRAAEGLRHPVRRARRRSRPRRELAMGFDQYHEPPEELPRRLGPSPA